MKFTLNLGSNFSNQIIGVRFVMCLTVASIESPRNSATNSTHRRIMLEASFGESQHASSRIYSNDIPNDKIEDVLINLSNSISGFSGDQKFNDAVRMIRDCSNGVPRC